MIELSLVASTLFDGLRGPPDQGTKTVINSRIIATLSSFRIGAQIHTIWPPRNYTPAANQETFKLPKLSLWAVWSRTSIPAYDIAHDTGELDFGNWLETWNDDECNSESESGGLASETYFIATTFSCRCSSKLRTGEGFLYDLIHAP